MHSFRNLANHLTLEQPTEPFARMSFRPDLDYLASLLLRPVEQELHIPLPSLSLKDLAFMSLGLHIQCFSPSLTHQEADFIQTLYPSKDESIYKHLPVKERFCAFVNELLQIDAHRELFPIELQYLSRNFRSVYDHIKQRGITKITAKVLTFYFRFEMYDDHIVRRSFPPVFSSPRRKGHYLQRRTARCCAHIHRSSEMCEPSGARNDVGDVRTCSDTKDFAETTELVQSNLFRLTVKRVKCERSPLCCRVRRVLHLKYWKNFSNLDGRGVSNSVYRRLAHSCARECKCKARHLYDRFRSMTIKELASWFGHRPVVPPPLPSEVL